jgi:hypothetical protein
MSGSIALGYGFDGTRVLNDPFGRIESGYLTLGFGYFGAGYPIPGFSQSTITEATTRRGGVDLLISWTSTSPEGTLFQAYLDRRLAWWGTERKLRYPWPTKHVQVDIGTVGSSQGPVDFSADLPAIPDNRAKLSWVYGTYLSPTFAGFYVYQGPTPGSSVSYTAPVATVPAYELGPPPDGWGVGRWGDGVWGGDAVYYSWTSPRLAPGTWHFDVLPFNSDGTPCGSHTSVTAIIAAVPPNPPAPNSSGQRLTYTYNASTHIAALHWQASP